MTDYAGRPVELGLFSTLPWVRDSYIGKAAREIRYELADYFENKAQNLGEDDPMVQELEVPTIDSDEPLARFVYMEIARQFREMNKDG